MYSKLHKKRMGQSITSVKEFLDSLGEPIGKGIHHKVYNNPNNNFSVIKTGTRVLEHGEIFKKFPEYCPKVYDIVNCGSVNENYIVIEKLDINSFMLQIIDVYIGIKVILEKESINNVYIRNFINQYKYSDKYVYVRPVIKRISTLNRIHEIVINTGMRDVQSRNFGYTKEGKLKALDI
jgi:hypothetical protein